MKFGDMTSVLQLGVALNLAYFTFREILTTATREHERVVKKTDEAIARALSVYSSVPEPKQNTPFAKDAIAWRRSRAEAQNLQLHISNQELEQNPFADNIFEFDKVFRYACLIVAALALIGLIVSSAVSDSPIEIWCFSVISAICFAPTAFVIWYNWTIARMIEGNLPEVIARGKLVEEQMQLFLKEIADT